MKTGLFAFVFPAVRAYSRLSHGAIMITLATAALWSSGCTHVAKTRAKTNAELREHSRAFTTAVVDTLHAQPADRRDAFTELALQIAQHDQRVEGFPLDPLRVDDLLALESGTLPPAEAEARQKLARKQLDHRLKTIQQLQVTERRAEERLLAFGAQFEEARNDQRVRWFKRGTVLTLIAGAIAALVVFVPASIPLLGRLLAWCVGRFPALAGMAGVVSVKAFDAVVKAIERTKSAQPFQNHPHQFGNHSATTPHLEELHWQLSREMDAAHKALVRKRKTALALDR